MKTKAQLKFEESRMDYTDRELMMELLYSNWKVQNATERTRSNASTLVWFVVIGIILSFISGLMGAAAVL
ncbi:MAG: hypothetical protein JJ885_12925 [Muricauda sp.]|nr:hypothetical protein [Allomuricauda sp.]MBO6532713.1 hypothetical protein [Allomuricauda sp.]MBO6590190.1 hypothetical protein [Allomuricauda sp.]MBO6619662.1 hypothetical protein [Allomuricauda sp.]MBO6645711.1 hypothetical protein [Allomuricauda sp.]MBO6748000.1 hypothetical protein [Allomuricauda sp.]